jgi:hypothetical protein
MEERSHGRLIRNSLAGREKPSFLYTSKWPCCQKKPTLSAERVSRAAAESRIVRGAYHCCSKALLPTGRRPTPRATAPGVVRFSAPSRRISAFSRLSAILSLWQKSVRIVSGWQGFGSILAQTLPNTLALSATPKSPEVDGFSSGKSGCLQAFSWTNYSQMVADGSRW